MKIYAFGQLVPDDFIDELVADGIPRKDINTEYLETLLWFDYQDEQ
jgi:uncharacterized protein YggE